MLRRMFLGHRPPATAASQTASSFKITCLCRASFPPASLKHRAANFRMQIAAWLKRHDGRPGVAQSSMSEQLVDVEVTSSRESEAAAYEVSRSGTHLPEAHLNSIPLRSGLPFL